MEIRQRDTGALLTESQFRAQFSSVSLPKALTAEVLEPYGYDPVLNGPQAQVTAPYEYSVRDGVEWSSGNWFTKFVVGPTFTTTTDEEGVTTTADEKMTAYRAGVDAQAAERVRTKRNQTLADTDWTQLADSSADATAWATYRTALRNLPTTDGFPHNVTWPTEPS